MTSVVPAQVSLHVCLRALLLLLMLTWCQGAVRNYYIASRDVLWNYCPGGVNLVDPNDQVTADKYVVPGTSRVGSKRLKTLFFQYTDQTYTTEMVKPAYQGLLGPIIRGEVGDVIVVYFFNNASRNYSIHPHGVFYEKKSEGALYLDGTSGISKEDDSVMPGCRVTVTWNVTVSDAPAEGDPACLPWVYHSHINTRRDVSTGMIGVVVTCKPGTLNSKNERVDVDVEVPLFVMNWDENISWHHRDNINTFCLSPSTCQHLADSSDPGFVDSNLMRSVNGRSFGTLEGLEVCVGDRVQFYVIGFGNEMDVHSMHFHGQNLKYQHRSYDMEKFISQVPHQVHLYIFYPSRGDTVSVYSATFVAVATRPSNPGRWLIADFVDDHQKEGTAAFYNVKTCPNKGYKRYPSRDGYSGTTREFFLTAEEITWNYGPTGLDGRTMLPLTTAGSPSNLYFNLNQTRLGGVYKKAKFIQYTSSLFCTKVSSSPKDAHLGILGPVLRVEVGDRVVVTLKNLLPFPVSFLTHGLSYDVAEEDKGEPTVF
ncbi:hephaestin-like [Physella acuta]|uniref:hephaestin-like n=1 Tax=Physella acuta TaxID=109671 RepID=UPI0027DBE36A|nr:hephaestin-like [Physella acuta]